MQCFCRFWRIPVAVLVFVAATTKSLPAQVKETSAPPTRLSGRQRGDALEPGDKGGGSTPGVGQPALPVRCGFIAQLVNGAKIAVRQAPSRENTFGSGLGFCTMVGWIASFVPARAFWEMSGKNCKIREAAHRRITPCPQSQRLPGSDVDFVSEEVVQGPFILCRLLTLASQRRVEHDRDAKWVRSM